MKCSKSLIFWPPVITGLNRIYLKVWYKAVFFATISSNNEAETKSKELKEFNTGPGNENKLEFRMLDNTEVATI